MHSIIAASDSEFSDGVPPYWHHRQDEQPDNFFQIVLVAYLRQQKVLSQLKRVCVMNVGMGHALREIWTDHGWIISAIRTRRDKARGALPAYRQELDAELIVGGSNPPSPLSWALQIKSLCRPDGAVYLITLPQG
jgi:hypothetical protein